MFRQWLESQSFEDMRQRIEEELRRNRELRWDDIEVFWRKDRADWTIVAEIVSDYPGESSNSALRRFYREPKVRPRANEKESAPNYLLSGADGELIPFLPLEALSSPTTLFRQAVAKLFP